MSDYTPDNPPNKRCPKCGQVYPATAEYFHRRKSSRDGLERLCKKCGSARALAYYHQNAELQKEKRRHYYRDNPEKERARARKQRQDKPDYFRNWQIQNREKTNEAARRYRERNPEKIRAAVRNSRLRHHEERLERDKEYKRKNKERIAKQVKRRREANLQSYREADRRHSHMRRAWQRGSGGSYTEADIQRLYEKQGGRCLYCETELNGTYEVDHFIPLKRGGWNSPDNLALACPYCNRKKQAQLPYDCPDWSGSLPVEWRGRLL